MISAAEPATARASPNLGNWLLLGIGLGGMLSLLATAMRETFDKIRPAQTASLLLPGMPAATLLPVSPRVTIPSLVSHGLDPSSAFGRAVRSVHERLRTLTRGRDSFALALVSLKDNDGKNLLVTALAQQFAASGVAVAVIDATNHSSRLSEAFGLPGQGGQEPSSGRLVAGANVIHDHGSGIDIITPGDLVHQTEWLARLIAQLRNDHKIILVNLPGISLDQRTALLARATDTTLLVVEPDRNEPGADHALIQTLAALGRKPALAVVSQVSTSCRGWISSAAAGCQLRVRRALRAAFGRRSQTPGNTFQDQV
jgi:Mrp family chromosome partitioning ATPase